MSRRLPYIPLAARVRFQPRRALQNVLIKLYDLCRLEVDDE